jgi:gamma-glutamylputrescine oxidase
MVKSIDARSYYLETANLQLACESLKGEISADVCVIGAGYTGLSAALELADAGYKVVVLEAERIGYGASGRNGGQVCTGFSSGQTKIESSWGRPMR